MKYYTEAEVAELLEVFDLDPFQIRRWIISGELKANRHTYITSSGVIICILEGNDYKISEEDLNEFVLTKVGKTIDVLKEFLQTLES